MTIEARGLNAAILSLRLLPRQLRRAEVRTVNKGATAGRTEAVKEIRSKFTVKAAIVRSNIKIKKANRASNPIEAKITASPASISLIEFKASQTKKGVNVTIEKGKGRKHYPGHFIAEGKITLNDGRVIRKKQVFYRPRVSAGGKRVGRLPIKVAYGPSLPALFLGPIDKITRITDARVQKIFLQELNFELIRNRG